MAGLMAGITKQTAIPYFVLNILQFSCTFQSLFWVSYYLYIDGKNNPKQLITLDFFYLNLLYL